MERRKGGKTTLHKTEQEKIQNKERTKAETETGKNETHKKTGKTEKEGLKGIQAKWIKCGTKNERGNMLQSGKRTKINLLNSKDVVQWFDIFSFK